MEKSKLVTLEMFEEYHKKLMKHITGRDNASICPECEDIIFDGKCEKCHPESKDE